MKLLDERGIGTVWSICKEKFALAGHTHNYAGSGSPGGSANSAIGVVDYNQTDKTIQIGYSGTGITGDQIKYIAGYTDGGGNVNAKIKDVSKDALKSWLGLGLLAYSSSSIPTKLSQLTNDKGFVTGSVSGNTVTINGASTTWTNTWRGIQDNLTSTSASESLSANQGRVLKGLVDEKANSSDLSSYVKKSEAMYSANVFYSLSSISLEFNDINEERLEMFDLEAATDTSAGVMSVADKSKLDGIASGANNYTLPIATAGTLGGVKVSGASGNIKDSTDWPIFVNNDGVIHTSIDGLNRDNLYGTISNVTIKSSNYSSIYDSMSITRYNNNGLIATLALPDKTGKLALTSDIPSIPDVSNLCRFNFINSISECVNGRINFLFGNFDGYVDLSFLSNLEEGTILLIYNPVKGFEITHKGAVWYYNGIAKGADETMYIQHAKLLLAFFNTYAYISMLNY